MLSSKRPKRKFVRSQEEDTGLIQEIKRIVVETTRKDLVSLYLIGSFLSKDVTNSSDMDLVEVMKPDFDFRQEARLNKSLNRKLRPNHRIDLGTMGYDEFFGGTQKGSLTKHVELPIFLNFLKQAQLLHGKRINFNKLPVKPATPEQELKYHIREFGKYAPIFRKRNRISPDFSFRDFIKFAFYIANLELQLSRNLTPRRDYSEIVKAFRENKAHIVHYSMKLRLKKTISPNDRLAWLSLAERYVAQMKTYAN